MDDDPIEDRIIAEPIRRMDAGPSPLLNMFNDDRFVRVPNSRWLYSGIVDDAKWGIIAATYNQSFSNFSLNCVESKRLNDAKDSGRIQQAWVVKTKYDTQTNQRRVVEAIELSRVMEMLRGVEPREGSYGAFWTLAAFDDDAW
jgi:hypothetical protein